MKQTCLLPLCFRPCVGNVLSFSKGSLDLGKVPAVQMWLLQFQSLAVW